MAKLKIAVAKITEIMNVTQNTSLYDVHATLEAIEKLGGRVVFDKPKEKTDNNLNEGA